MKPTLISLAILGILGASFPPTDAAPPAEPPGSSILPPGETMVQMASEFVLMAINPSMKDDAPLEVYARFVMRNQGEANEQMQVRFPLEDPYGLGDGYGGRPLIEQVSVQVGGHAVAPERVEEPWTADWPPVFWAAFPVNFPPATNVTIEVRYATNLYRSPDGSDQARASYILDTGEGWYGPIGSAIVVLRFPYPIGASNFLVPEPSEYQTPQQPVFVGHEVRFEFEDFEPNRDNLYPTFVWPGQWGNILDLEALTGRHPSDIDAAIALSQAYRRAGTDRHGFLYYEPLYRLSRQAIFQALAYESDSPTLHLELAKIELDRCWYEFTSACIPPILARIDSIATVAPGNPDVATVQADAEYLATYFTDREKWYRAQTATYMPRPTQTLQPQRTLLPSATATPPLATTPYPQTGPSAAPSQRLAAALVPFILGATAASAAFYSLRKRK